MNKWFAYLIPVCLLITACDRAPQQLSAPPVETGPSHPASKPLTPLFSDVSFCIAECDSKWYRVPQNSLYSSPTFQPKLPLKFADHVAHPEEFGRFAAMVEQLPPNLRSIGKLGPEDEEATITSTFGSYTKERPKLYGELYNVIKDKQRLIYVYSNVYYPRIKDKIPGSLHVAVDPETREQAGVMRGGSSLDEYYVVGAKSLHSTLLAYTVAHDLETANMLAHYARKEPGQYESTPIVFPLGQSKGEAIARVGLLNDHLGNSSEASGIPAPDSVKQAEATRSSSIWYGLSQGRERCIESPMSPADRIDIIKSAGITPRVRETNVGGKLASVEVVADDGRHETTWRFFRSKVDCESAMVAASTPEKYR